MLCYAAMLLLLDGKLFACERFGVIMYCYGLLCLGVILYVGYLLH